MTSIQRLFVLGSTGISALLFAIVSGCATGGGTAGPTVAIQVSTFPPNIKVLADDTMVGDSPTKVNALVDASGRLLYDLDITADYSRSGAGRAMGADAPKPVYVRLTKGMMPPAEIVFDTRRGTPRGEATTLNPEGTRSSATGRVGSRDPDISEIAEAVEPAATALPQQDTGGRGGAGGGLGGSAGGRGGR